MSDIDSMPAGPELDALVAVQVMGWTRLPDHVDGLVVHPMYRTPEGGTTSYPPAYSKNIAAAWDVVERMKEEYDFQIANDQGEIMEWYVDIVPIDGGEVVCVGRETAPAAICVAALKATAKP